jgi:FMN phosphatase YigB (HAD superfamily)
MPKVVLLDGDGVVLKKGKEYFSERFVREYGAPSQELINFFKKEFRLCQQGKADLKEELTKRLPAWGWQKSTEEYLEYWFNNDVILDEEVLTVAQELQERGIDCYLTTDQEQYRKEYVLKKLQGKLKGAWFSCDLGFQKSQPEFFQEVMRRWETRYLPHEIAYWDDEQRNIDTARLVGIHARLFTSVDDLKSNLKT